MEFEKEFDVSIPDEQAEKIQTVGQAIEYLEAQSTLPNTRLLAHLIPGLVNKKVQSSRALNLLCSARTLYLCFLFGFAAMAFCTTKSNRIRCMKRVVVTGLGAITPIGNTLSAYLEGLQKGASGANLITQFDASLFKTRFACEVKGFEVENYIDRREARRIDRFTQFAIVTSAEALADSGLDLDAIDKQRVGVIWASGIGGLATLEKEIEDHLSSATAFPNTTRS
jgi:hypothetical protein